LCHHFTFNQEKKQDAQGPLTTSCVWLVSLFYWCLARFDTEQGDCASSTAGTNEKRKEKNFFWVVFSHPYCALKGSIQNKTIVLVLLKITSQH